MRRMHTKLQAAAENTYASWRYGYAGLASGRQENVIRMRKQNFNQPLLKLRMRREGDLLFPVTKVFYGINIYEMGSHPGIIRKVG